MIDKPSFIDSLNGSGLFMLSIVVIAGYKLLEILGKIIAKFAFKKAKEEGVKLLAKQVAEEVMIIYVPKIRKEATEIYNKIDDSIKIISKNNEENRLEIKELRSQIGDYRASHHDTLKTLHGVLNVAMDTLKDYSELIVKKKRKPRKKTINGKYNNDIQLYGQDI